MASDHGNDLPLMANSCDIHLYHYMLDLQCDLTKHVFSGSIYLFLDPVREEGDSRRVFSSQEYHRQLLDISTLTRKDVGHIRSDQRKSGHGITSGDVNNAAEIMNRHCAGDMKSMVLDTGDIGSRKVVRPDDDGSAEGVTKKRRRLSVSGPDDVAPPGTWQAGDPCLVLDACDLDVMGVYEVDIPEKDLITMARSHLSLHEDVHVQPANRGSYKAVQKAPTKALHHQVDKWCIKIWKDGVKEYQDFPRLVQVRYSTKPSGSSLRWTKDQDNNPCVFTAAMWVNNRAFFPTAEYGNLSTWQCRITTPGGTTVLMSADGPGTQEEVHTHTDGPMTRWYHRCSSPLPPHTLAVAVGLWHHRVLADDNTDQGDASRPALTCSHVPGCSVSYSARGVLPCRVYGAPSVVPRAARVLSPYWASCSRATQQLLGACPFPHIDLLIYPPCVQDMALSNPGLIFLSQSLLAEDGSMNVRLGHELSHSWFGLLIGARDWTEEWLSEGFATFVEDAIHAATLRISEQEEVDRGELRALIRYKVLTAEMENTQEDLQTLRPDPAHEEMVGHSAVMYVKNGLNPNKQFTQVHYLKGYFLLRHLSTLIGMRRFNSALTSYIKTFHGQLVRSQDFLNHVFQMFPDLREHGLTVEKIYSDWLDVPGMPKVLEGFQPSRDNSLYSQVVDEVAKWGHVITSTKKSKKKCNQTQRNSQMPTFVSLESDQLVLLLEELLSSPHTLRAGTLRLLKQTYTLQAQNADVRHRWCELVVKHGYRPGYDDVRAFLCHDQAMGVYLYGELVLSGCRVRRELAEQCFQLVGADMEEGTRTTVRTMLYGGAPS